MNEGDPLGKMCGKVFKNDKKTLKDKLCTLIVLSGEQNKVQTHGYCLSGVSMCIARHSAKPLISLGVEILSRALAGLLLASTIPYVNNCLVQSL